MKLAELKVGMLLDACMRRYDFRHYMRVEFIAYDWAVARDDENSVHLLTEGDSMDEYKEPITEENL